jgi:hypothetical protein
MTGEKAGQDAAEIGTAHLETFNEQAQEQGTELLH